MISQGTSHKNTPFKEGGREIPASGPEPEPGSPKVRSERPLPQSEALGLARGRSDLHPGTRTLDPLYIFTRISARASRALDSPEP